jgi:hypothetical protein
MVAGAFDVPLLQASSIVCDWLVFVVKLFPARSCFGGSCPRHCFVGRCLGLVHSHFWRLFLFSFLTVPFCSCFALACSRCSSQEVGITGIR